MKTAFVIAVSAVAVTVFSAHAAIEPSGAVAIQLQRSSQPGNEANGNPNLDDAFVRGEGKLKGTTDVGLSGLVHLRFEAKMASGAIVDAQLRQGFFSLPVSILTLQAGRWYEIYTVGAYFGRYLFGTPAHGSGTMCVNYSILDGVRLKVPLVKDYNTDLHLALLPNVYTFEDIYVMILASSQPLEFLTLNLGANIQAVEPGDADPMHRAIVNASYQIIENLNVFAEYGITDLSAVGDNSWILAGVDIPTAGILNMLRCEIEFTKDRLGPDTYGDLALMFILRKKIAGVQIDLNVGSDPKGLGSKKLKHVGGYLRLTGSF